MKITTIEQVKSELSAFRPDQVRVIEQAAGMRNVSLSRLEWWQKVIREEADLSWQQDSRTADRDKWCKALEYSRGLYRISGRIDVPKIGEVIAGDIKGVVFEEMEDTRVARMILGVVQEWDGKRLLSGFEKALKAKVQGARVNNNRNTEIEWGGHTSSGGRAGGRLLVACQTKQVVLDAKFLEEQNRAWYAAADERNAARSKLLSESSLAFLLLGGLVETYRLTKPRIDELLEGNLSVIKHPLRSMIYGEE